MRMQPFVDGRGNRWRMPPGNRRRRSIRDAMLAILKDASRPIEERGGAAVGLYPAADRDDVRRELEALYEAGGLGRAKALESMWRSLYKPYARYFAPHLEDKDLAVLRQALRGAGYFRLTPYADKIATYFDAEGDLEDLRDDALFAYALAMPGETTRGRALGCCAKSIRSRIFPLRRSSW